MKIINDIANFLYEDNYCCKSVKFINDNKNNCKVKLKFKRDILKWFKINRRQINLHKLREFILIKSVIENSNWFLFRANNSDDIFKRFLKR